LARLLLTRPIYGQFFTSRGINLAYSNVGTGTPPAGISLADSNHTAWHMNQTQYSPANPAGLCAQNCHFNPDPSVWDFYTRSPFDNAAPQILAAYGTSASRLVSLRFSKPVYGPTGGALQPADLVLADASGRTISSVDHVAGGNIAILTLSAVLDGGLNNDTVAPAATVGSYDRTGIYDQIGNRLPATPVLITTGDTTAPTMTILSPANGATNVASSAPVTFTLGDGESGVLWSSVTVTLSGSLGYAARFTSGSAQLSKAGSASNYNVTLTLSIRPGYGETITAIVDATDAMGNPLTPPTWIFTTAAAPAPVSMRLHPSGAVLGGTDGWSITPLNFWGTSLDATEASANYAYGSGSATTTFNVELDNPPAFSGPVQSIAITAVIQINSGTGGFPFTLGWRVGASGTPAAGATGSGTVTVSGAAWSTQTINVPIAASLAYADIVALQAFVTRSTTGTHTDWVTELYADVTYLP
jgi:Bacterial Ig-like domain